MTVEILETEALRLDPADIARLVERLIASLDSGPEVEAAWAAEVERRNAEIESGAVPLLPGPETLARLKSEYLPPRGGGWGNDRGDGTQTASG